MDTLKQVEIWRLTERENYRQEYDEQFVADTASDMASNGFKIEYPIPVYEDGDQFVVIDGHTRRRAALLGSTYDRKEHKARLLVWIAVKPKPSDCDFKLQQLAANERRRNPNEISDAIGYQQALTAGATLKQISDATGHDADYLNRRLNLLKLVPEAQKLVATKQLPIKSANCMVDLDTNFQRIALKAYNEKRYHLDEFAALCNGLLEKQRTCSLFDLALFNGQPIEQTLDSLKVERPRTKEQIQAELDATKQALQAEKATHEANKRKAVMKFQQMQKELIQLRSQLQKVS